MTRDELLRSLIAESARLQSLREDARQAGRADVAAEIYKAGEAIAAAVGKLAVSRESRMPT